MSCLSALAFPFALLLLILKYSVDVPFWDQWDILPVIEQSYRGTLSLHMLWLQHNEHRMLFPRIVMIALARLTGWNTRAEMLTNFALACAVFSLILVRLRASAKSLTSSLVYLALPLASLLVFSLNQWENWFDGMQIAWFLCLLCSLLSIYLVSKSPVGFGKVFFGAVAAFVASYSMAAGFVVWPVGLVSLLLLMPRGSTGKRIAAFVWVVMMLLTFATYFYRYYTPPHHPSAFAFLLNPRYYTNIFAYFGSPLSGFNLRVAHRAGAIGAFVFAAAVYWLLSRSKFSFKDIATYVFWGLFAILTCMMIAAGRVGFGTGYAIGSRYIMFSTVLWLCDFILLLHLIASLKSPSWVRWGRLFFVLSMVYAAFWVSLGWHRSMVEIKAKYSTLDSARCLLTEEAPPDEVLAVFYPRPDTVRGRLEVLERYELSVFREGSGCTPARM